AAEHPPTARHRPDVCAPVAVHVLLLNIPAAVGARLVRHALRARLPRCITPLTATGVVRGSCFVPRGRTARDQRAQCDKPSNSLHRYEPPSTPSWDGEV